MLQIGLIVSLFAFFGQSHAGINLKACEINAVMKRKDSNCVGILSDQGKAATASNQLRLGLTPCIMCVQYRGGVLRTVGGYHEYRGGIS